MLLWRLIIAIDLPLIPNRKDARQKREAEREEKDIQYIKRVQYSIDWTLVLSVVVCVAPSFSCNASRGKVVLHLPLGIPDGNTVTSWLLLRPTPPSPPLCRYRVSRCVSVCVFGVYMSLTRADHTHTHTMVKPC